MKKAIIIFFSILSLYSKAQYNLVPNPSFEIYSTCPTSSNQLNYATGWINPTISSPDYFNSCSSTFGVPSYCNCTSVYQYANTGNAYCGIWCKNSTVNSREYLQVQLNTNLQIGKCYKVNFYANVVNWAGYACNNLGMYLSTNQINSTGPSVLLNYSAQIKNFGNKIITDTLNWVKISGIYTANGGESYLTIGNFNDDVSTDTITINTSSSLGAYYNIDDISIIPIDSIIGGMPANAGVDKSIAIGDSAFIGQEISNLNCNWYELPGNTLIASNTSGMYVTPNTTTSYVVEQNLCGNVTYDTVKVVVSPTGINDYEALQSSFVIYPNPNNGNIFISTKEKNVSSIMITVTDITGKVLYNEQMSVTNSFVNFNLNVRAGTYFVTIVNTHTNEKIIKKLMVQ